MATDDLERRLALLQVVAETYGRDFSKPLGKIWMAALADIDIDALEHAVAAHIQDPIRGRFTPTPADLIRLARGIRDDSAARAWGRFFAAANACHNYRNRASEMAFDDAALHATIAELGGSSVLFRAGEFELSRLRKDFDAIYLGHLARTVEPGSYPATLPVSRDVPGSPLRLFGDRARALAVVAAGAGAHNYLELTSANQPLLECNP